MDKSLASMFDLSGKVAVVTGASRGLGVSFAKGLVKAGCSVAITARNNDLLQQVAEELRAYKTEVYPIQMDVTNNDEVKTCISKIVQKFGHIDILVNNAGISAVEKAEEMSLSNWNSVINTNVTGVFHCAQAVGKVMLTQKQGTIINIASMYAFVGSSYVPQVSYTASKAAVLGLTRELAVEWGEKGVQVMALAPGFFLSDQTKWAFENNVELANKLLAKIPLGRMGKLEELEGTIVYLASTASNYLHGQALTLDGGFLSW
ncbi:MAG: SDR family NAD(P)-dependent oxidoreductase [Bacteroidetes bacterium]|nr:SDR family NAD(P)-dependent oxidoreductase [Bacteroidota bacterium]